MAEPPFYSDPEASPVCPICGWYLEEAYRGCPDHGPVEPVYTSLIAPQEAADGDTR